MEETDAIWNKRMVYINSPPQTNTFQVGLVTDGTFGFAIFNYEEDQMLWNVAALASKNVIIGFNTGSGQYVNTQFQDPPFSTIADRFRPDQFVGNTGLGGRWIYRLEANNDTTINPKKFCLDWYDVQPAHQDWSRFLGTCPCTFSQAGNDRRLRSPGRRGGAVSPVGNSYRRLSKEVLDEIEERQGNVKFCKVCYCHTCYIHTCYCYTYCHICLLMTSLHQMFITSGVLQFLFPTFWPSI